MPTRPTGSSATPPCWPATAWSGGSSARGRSVGCGAGTWPTAPCSRSSCPRAPRSADVGSGAGLPGLPLALVRPDVRVVLVEPLLRRSTFLSEAVEALGLAERVEVLRGRAEDVALEVDVVTARAVAPLDRLAGWTLPLARLGGTLLALKGEGALEEIVASAAALEKVGGGRAEVLECGVGLVDPPTTVVRVVRLAAGRRKGRSAGGAR
ncbi:MAG: 16S rRNA (guanine(527)-N(7))-methyltransferase RsmG [Candidatus Nanopelagicales bacterium]